MCEESLETIIECMIKKLNEESVPLGTIIIRPTINIPKGYLECNGSEISREEYSKLFEVLGSTYGDGDSITTFNLPDLRGEFIRGYDNNRGIDNNRIIGSWQKDEFKAHNHKYSFRNSSSSDVDDGKGARYGTTSSNTSTVGGLETRPRNIAMVYCIKY